MTFVTNPRRDASATIAGFVFQVNLTILRWLGLQDGEHLELECGEDVDTVQNRLDDGIASGTRLLEQIKARSGRTLTLRSEEALEALSNFCSHRAANPALNLKFRYITTATSGVEQGWDRPESGIETWTALRRGRYDDAARPEAIAALRTFLKSCSRPGKVPADVWHALQQVLASGDDVHLTEVILAFEWGIGYGDYAQTEIDILAALTRDAHKISQDEKKKVYEHLFAFVFRLLCQAGRKVLTIRQLTTELQSVSPADSAILQLIRNELDQMSLRIGTVEAVVVQQANDVTALKQAVGLVGRSFGFDAAFALSAVSLSTELPDVVNPCAPRAALVDGLLARVQADGAVALVAEPGSGKTQLLLLALRKANRQPRWLNIPRHATEAQTCILLDALVRSVGEQPGNLPFRESCDAAADQFRGAFVVIEDLPRVVPGGPLAMRIETLALCLRKVDAYLFASSYFRLPATTEQAVGNIHCDVPRFTTADVGELLAAAEAPQPIRTEKTSQLLVAVAEGLPILVMAAVRYLAGRSWNFTTTEFESLFRGEFASAHRHDANALLQITVPDAEERELLIRMSLAMGVFTLEDIASVARVRRAIFLPGEKIQRATGLWLQQVGHGRYLRSPLITSGLADSLDPTTRTGVHYVLALRILARKTLEPIEAFACVNHLMMAGDMSFAVIVVIQTLAAFIELDEMVEDDFLFARMWPSASFLAKVDVNLQINLRAMQIVVLAKQGKDVLPTVGMLDTLIAEVGGTGWGIAIATSALAVNLARQMPMLANKYLLLALATFADARLPDGSPLPLGDSPLESVLWITAHGCKSDAEIDSWLATISRLTPAQIEKLKNSELMEDNVTILCDGIWLRVYLKPEAERDWSPVKKKLGEVEATARAIGFSLLEAAAIRTQIMILAEWENELATALSLSESSLERFPADDCRFLIFEVTGRQLSYAGKPQEAVTWLDRALACDAYCHSLWRRNVLITLAELHGPRDPHAAAEFTAEAVRIAQDGKLVESLYIETLAELGIALWNAGERLKSFEIFEEATNRLFATQTDANSWKGQFGRIFAVIAYFSGVAFNGKPQEGHVEPKQGLFLASNDQAYTGYRSEQLAYICVRLAMFADGVRDILKAAAWTWSAIESARQIPTAWNAVRLATWHAIPATLLSDDFVRAGQLASIMMQVDVNDIVAEVRTSTDIHATERMPTLESLVAAVPVDASKSGLRVMPIVPIAIRLATLHFRGGTTAATAASLADIDSVIPPGLQPENFVAQMRRALVDEIDWQVLRDEGYRAIENHEYVRGYVLCIGAIDKAPVLQSLYLQTSIAQHFAGLFKTCPSIYREIVAPFFAAYWERTIAQSTGLFRTALAYTERQLGAADGSAEGTRKLLGAMRFCLGVTLPQQTTEWLDASA
jgi:tetratricopeptide (TPR) repeat protein